MKDCSKGGIMCLVYRITAEDFKIHPELLEMSGDPDANVANKQAQFGTYRTSKF